MNFNLIDILNWITQMGPDKLAFVLPAATAYVIKRCRKVSDGYIWIICPLLAMVLFMILSEPDLKKSPMQNYTTNASIGIILGYLAALFALSLHSVLFKQLAAKYPFFNFLILIEEDETPTAPAQVPLVKPTEQKPTDTQ